MKIKPIHDWNVTPTEAGALQKRLAGRIIQRPLKKIPRLIAGLDCALSMDKKRIAAVIIVLSFPELELVEVSQAVEPLQFPYIPGLLSFREIPVYLTAAAGLTAKPDLFLVDGQGIAHPRRMGLASHLGLFLDTPMIGCAKSRLIGTYDPPGEQKGSFTLLKDKKRIFEDGKTAAAHRAKPRREAKQDTSGEEIIGAVLRTRTGTKPLFVSPGHLCTLDDAVAYTLRCCTKYRLPEPTRLAHQYVTRLKPEI